MKNNFLTHTHLELVVKLALYLLGCVIVYILSATTLHAATLSLSPATGVYQANTTFSVTVLVNTKGQPINASEGTIRFNPNELSVVSVNRSGSIFNLWVAEPTYSNSVGTVSFSGGLPSGYTGSAGNIMTVTFRALGSGPTKVNFSGGSVLANDGKGTNVLTSMGNGSYTVQAASVVPETEIIEYIASANTPTAPIIKSATHSDPDAWHTNKTASLNWVIPQGVTAIRTLLDQNPTSIPTKVYDTPISSIELPDLPEGKSYFHIQFKNADGWGKVTHYRLAIDTVRPNSIDISHEEGADLSNPNQVLLVAVDDATSEVKRFQVKLDNSDPFEYRTDSGSSTIPLPQLEPGYHSVIIEAFDEAGNSIIGTYSFTVISFEKPVFTEYPSEMNEEVIPVIKGITKPRSIVAITLQKVGSEPAYYQVNSDDTGEFIFIPEGTLSTGVYELSAVATDEHGALSDKSDIVRIAVQQPGYLRIGSMLISVLSIVIPLLVLVAALFIGFLYLLRYARSFKTEVRTESAEALSILGQEFSTLRAIVRQQATLMQEARKNNKLTKTEAAMIDAIDVALQSSQAKVAKEIKDVSALTKDKLNN